MNKIKKGQKIKLFFRCAGCVSEESRIIKSFDEKTIITTTTISPDCGGEEYEMFNRKTGKCKNDNTSFGASRYIEPQ